MLVLELEPFSVLCAPVTRPLQKCSVGRSTFLLSARCAEQSVRMHKAFKPTINKAAFNPTSNKAALKKRLLKDHRQEQKRLKKLLNILQEDEVQVELLPFLLARSTLLCLFANTTESLTKSTTD